MTTSISLSSPVVRGDVSSLAPHILAWVGDCVDLCTPKDVHIMDGSPQEDRELKTMLVKKGVLTPLPKYDNCFLQELTLEMWQGQKVALFSAHQRGSILFLHLKEFKGNLEIGWIQRN
eukprot:TRINITY_DN771_c0_g1_i10.p1 TRINITY_DN771_c0_g1~~TRINITY_DN771_c0_g1_i10.p1  ORF type:complete len:118 (-),score=22.38 TRINITY_DN771_c0_g1_i10:158-511(-)